VTSSRQLALPFPNDPQYLPETYVRGEGNAEALAWFERLDSWPGCRLVVQGEAGAGKTHLLHVFAHQHQAALLSSDSVRVFMPLPDARSLAIDDADTVNNSCALLHLLNTAAERRIPTLLAGRSAPAFWHTDLLDLNSRLRASSVVTLHAPHDAILDTLLLRLLAERQLCVPDRLRAYMLVHLPRTGGALREAVARLDRLALSTGGRVTRAMAASAIDRSQSSELYAPSQADYDDLFSAGVSG
jgi:chromosomal replication initiation ATPase DnaA